MTGTVETSPLTTLWLRVRPGSRLPPRLQHFLAKHFLLCFAFRSVQVPFLVFDLGQLIRTGAVSVRVTARLTDGLALSLPASPIRVSPSLSSPFAHLLFDSRSPKGFVASGGGDELRWPFLFRRGDGEPRSGVLLGLLPRFVPFRAGGAGDLERDLDLDDDRRRFRLPGGDLDLLPYPTRLGPGLRLRLRESDPRRPGLGGGDRVKSRLALAGGDRDRLLLRSRSEATEGCARPAAPLMLRPPGTGCCFPRVPRASRSRGLLDRDRDLEILRRGGGEGEGL